MSTATMTTTSVRCIDCAHFDLQFSRQHSLVGFGHCKFDDGWRFKSLTYPRPGSLFKKADSEVIGARVTWATKHGLIEVDE